MSEKKRLPPICLMYFGGFLVLNSIFLDGDKQWLGFICGAVWFCSGYIVQAINDGTAQHLLHADRVTAAMRAAADRARNDWLSLDENDQIGALNAAIDAAFSIGEGRRQ